LAGTAPSAKPAPAPAAATPVIGSRKAVPIEFKLRAPKAQSVGLIGAFIVRGGRKEMARQGDGTWAVTLYLHPGQYRYFFSVDKKKQLDPENPRVDRGASLLEVP
jgi:1,4-alpha-glucan branching enzyme